MCVCVCLCVYCSLGGYCDRIVLVSEVKKKTQQFLAAIKCVLQTKRNVSCVLVLGTIFRFLEGNVKNYKSKTKEFRMRKKITNWMGNME